MGKRFPALFVVLMFSLGPIAQIGGSGGQGDVRGPGPLDLTDVWTDSFDDLSHVYVPAGGLSGVEVTGGQAQLQAGEDSGWIASSVISARPGMKYDYVFIEADTPGASSINVSIVNASAESVELGFANKTVDGFKLREGPYLSVLEVDWEDYPDIRIQVNLEAVGADRPVLYAWSLHYLDVEAWQDSFLWPGRMSDRRGLNFTTGGLEVNLTSMGGTGGQGDYEEFPPIVCSGGSGGPDVYYANTQRDNYQDRVSINIAGWSNSLTVDDLNNDGYFDLVVEMWIGRLRILWGDASGTWSTTGATTLNHPSSPQEVATGDFNGDGEVDIAVAENQGGGDNSYVYLNEGDGAFTDDADVTMSMDATRVSTGDLDGDGCDDILFSDSDAARVYMGDPAGPENTAAITFTTANCGDTLIKDVDGDGHPDVVLGERNGGKARIYLGDRDGPDTTADYELSVPDSVRACEAADVNGDGYTDVMFYSGSGSNYRLYIFEGNSQGWSDSRRHSEITHDNDGEALGTADLDKDGYGDIMHLQSIGGNDYRLKIWFGGTSWPSTPDIVKVGGYDNSVVAAIPKSGGIIRAYRGTFTTEEISLPTTSELKWDMLDLEGALPANTTMTLSVLDPDTGDPITGFEDLTDWNVDLSSIDTTSPSAHRTIQVEVTLASEFNNTTPVLNRLLIKWMDRRAWRDEFYGAGKVDRLLGLDVAGDELRAAALGGAGPQLVFPSIMGDDDYTTGPKVFLDAGGGDYLSWAPIEFGARGHVRRGRGRRERRWLHGRGLRGAQDRLAHVQGGEPAVPRGPPGPRDQT